MCVGCRISTGKRELIRIVRASDGSVYVDPSGKFPGRGAYLHPNVDCLDAATRKGAILRALRSGLGPEELGRLRRQVEGAMNA
jgi:predicted RNA-binding protein YlxR (DUF448 family)